MGGFAMPSNQFFSTLPGMPSQGGGNPSGFNFSPGGGGRDPVGVPVQSGGFNPAGGAPRMRPKAMDSGGGSVPSGAGNPFQVPGTSPSPYPGGPETGLTNIYGTPYQARTTNPGSENLGHGIIATGLQYPGLSQDFANYLMSQIGAGMAPFDLSTMLPGGGSTAPGQLSAGLNPILQQLMQFFQGKGSNMPGMNTLSDVATKGIDVLPEWQSMVAQMQQGRKTGEADLREQFAGMGDLAGSPFGTAMQQYQNQYGLDINSLLGQLNMQGILQGQLPAAESLAGMGERFGSGLQSLDQASIDRMYQEFQRTSPQNNPMLQDIMGMATLFPPTTKTPTTWDMINNTIGALSGAGVSSSSNSSTGSSSTQITF